MAQSRVAARSGRKRAGAQRAWDLFRRDRDGTELAKSWAAMRIAYVSTDPGVPAFGTKGASSHVQSMLRAFGRLGHEVVLLTRPPGAAPLGLGFVERVDLAPLPSGLGGVAEREAWRLADNALVSERLRSAGTIDLVYERHALFAHAAMEFARDLAIPGVLEVNAPLVEEQARHRSLIDRDAAELSALRSWNAAHSVVAVSSPLAQWLRERVQQPQHVYSVANGVDLARFDLELRNQSSTRHDRHEVEQPTFTVGFVGSLRPWHGLEALAESFALVRARAPEARLCIVGDGPGRAALEESLAATGSLRSTIFAGTVTPEEVPKWIASFDVAVAPYPALEDFYFSPLKLFEYMAAGAAVVASDIGQISSVVDDEIDGLLVRPGDAAELAKALLRLRDNPTLRARLGQRARAKMKGRDWLDVGRRVLAIAQRGKAEAEVLR